MPITKNPGPPLTSDHKGEETSVPRHWRAKLGLTKVVQEQPINVGIDPLAGQLIESRADQERTNERKKANTSFINNPATTPITEYVRTREGQVGTRARKYVPEGATPPSFNELTQEYTQQADGNGWAEQIFLTVASFLTRPTYIVSIENLIPAEFRARIPLVESELDVATSTGGQPNPNYTLATGEFRHEEQFVSLAVKRVKSVSLGAITPPLVHTNSETTEEYGGGVLDVILTLDTTGSLSVDTGPFVVTSKVTDLGNGYSIRLTKVLQGMSPSWPTLTEYDQDPETQALITTTYQVVDASGVVAPSIVNGVLTRFKKIDVWRSLKIVETYSLPADYDEQRFMAHQFPSLWDFSTYVYSTPCGPTGPIRQGFSTMVQARLHISFTTTKQTIVGLTLIPNTIRLVHDVINAVLNDVGGITYSGPCSGPIFFPASSPDFTTYTTTILGTEQLISGESVLWRAGLYKNSYLYVTML